MEPVERFDNGSVSVEVARYEASNGARLRLRDIASDDAIDLDPIELEGLTRGRYGVFSPLEETGFGPEPEDDEVDATVGEILQNEFAMVEVGRLQSGGVNLLLVRDLASRSHVLLNPVELQGLTRLNHKEFAPLLDPSDLVSEGEPDPDQV